MSHITALNDPCLTLTAKINGPIDSCVPFQSWPTKRLRKRESYQGSYPGCAPPQTARTHTHIQYAKARSSCSECLLAPHLNSPYCLFGYGTISAHNLYSKRKYERKRTPSDHGRIKNLPGEFILIRFLSFLDALIFVFEIGT